MIIDISKNKSVVYLTRRGDHVTITNAFDSKTWSTTTKSPEGDFLHAYVYRNDGNIWGTSNNYQNTIIGVLGHMGMNLPSVLEEKYVLADTKSSYTATFKTVEEAETRARRELTQDSEFVIFQAIKRIAPKPIDAEIEDL